jgi:hypothetical protein
MNINFWGVVNGNKAFLPYQASGNVISSTFQYFGLFAQLA